MHSVGESLALLFVFMLGIIFLFFDVDAVVDIFHSFRRMHWSTAFRPSTDYIQIAH